MISSRDEHDQKKKGGNTFGENGVNRQRVGLMFTFLALLPPSLFKVVYGRWSPRSFVLIRNLNIFVGIIKILSEFDQKRIKPTISSLRLEQQTFFLGDLKVIHFQVH